jgi:hypothetical protein
VQSRNRRKNVSRLLLVLLCLTVIRVSAVQAQANMQEANAIAAYPLTMDHVTRQFQLAMDLARDPQLKTQYSQVSDLRLEQRIQKVESMPKLAAAARARGITVRDLIMTSVALSPAIAVASLKDSCVKGPGPSRENRVFWAAAPLEHIQFYRDHKSEIDRLVVDVMRTNPDKTE